MRMLADLEGTDSDNSSERSSYGERRGSDSAGHSDTVSRSSASETAALAPPPRPAPSKGRGKGPPPPTARGKAPPPPRGKAPPPTRRGPSGTASLPIGRRLTLKETSGDAQAFVRQRSAPLECAGEEGALDRPPVDFGALRDAFTRKPVPERQLPGARKAPRVELLERGAAQTIAIALASVRVSTEELAKALRQLDLSACGLCLGDAERLLDVWPKAEALQRVAAYVAEGRETSLLRDVEAQLVPLALLPRAGQRLRLAVAAAGAREHTRDARTQLSRLQVATGELQASGVLRDILAIVVSIFNYVNFGTEAATSSLRGVEVQSLLRLRETKAYQADFPGFNMLHFLVQQLLRHGPELLSTCLDTELSSLPCAARVNLDGLRQELAELRSERAFLRREQREHAHEYAEPDEVESSPSQPPEGRTKRGLLAVIQDLVSMGAAWFRGDEVVGLPYHPASGSTGFETIHHEDDLAPPPGWLWLRRPSGGWDRCWCDVRGSVLVIFRIREEKCCGVVYVALPMARISLFSAAHATCDSGALLPAAPHGFEVQRAEGSQVVRLAGNSESEAGRWVAALTSYAARPGAGYLLVHQSGRALFGSVSLYCCWHGGVLRGYRRPRDGIDGTPPARAWPLPRGTAVLRELRSPFASAAARRLADDFVHFGFELEAPGQCWQFTCASYTEEQTWLRELGGQRPGVDAATAATSAEAATVSSASAASAALATAASERAGEGIAAAPRPGEDDDAAEEDGASGSESGSDHGVAAEGPRPRAVRLERLDRELGLRIRQWDRALAAAEADCRTLAAFFGMPPPPDHARLASTTNTLLICLVDFGRQLRAAWQDVLKLSPGLPPTPSRSAGHLERRGVVRA